MCFHISYLYFLSFDDFNADSSATMEDVDGNFKESYPASYMLTKDNYNLKPKRVGQKSKEIVLTQPISE